MNFSFRRVWAVLFRHLMIFLNPFQQINHFYWTLLDIVIFGFLTKSLAQGSDHDTTIILSNLVLWNFFSRGAINTSLTIEKDLADLSFVGLLATPLNLAEMMVSQMLFSIIGSLSSFCVAFLFVYFIFDLNVFSLGWQIFPAIGLLLVSGLAMGFLISTLLIAFGKKVSNNIYALAWLVVPFSCVFYPLEILPHFAQKIASFIPMSHVFEGLRTFVKHGDSLFKPFLMSMGLNVFYFICAITLFMIVFKHKKKVGFARLELEV